MVEDCASRSIRATVSGSTGERTSPSQFLLGAGTKALSFSAEDDPEPPPPGGAGAATVIEAVPLTPEADAIVLVVPAETPVATPLGLIIAMAGFTVAQDTFVRLSGLPSLNFPDAVNCLVSPTLTKALAGVTLIDCSVTVTACCCDEPPQPLVIMIASVAAAKRPILLKARC